MLPTASFSIGNSRSFAGSILIEASWVSEISTVFPASGSPALSESPAAALARVAARSLRSRSAKKKPTQVPAAGAYGRSRTLWLLDRAAVDAV